MPDAEVGDEFLGDSILTPLGMITRDTLDEGDVPPGDERSTDLATARPATPKHLEAVTVPGKYRVWLDDDQGPGPVGPKPAEEDPEGAVFGLKSGTLLGTGTLVNRQLLTQGGVLQSQGDAGHEGCPQANE